MNAKRRWRHQPAIEAGGGYRPFLVKDPVPAPGMLPALLIDVIAIFPCSPLLNWAFITVFDPVVVSRTVGSPILLSHTVRERAGIATRVRESTLMF